MTANAFTDDKMKAKEAGMDAHIAKPLNREVLVETVFKVITKKAEGIKQKMKCTLEVMRMKYK